MSYRKDHIPELDGLRGLAILLVIWAHVPIGLMGSGMAAVRAEIRPGILGVDLFFVLSGFLITRILLVERSKGIPLRGFLMRRFLRIFPIYYLLILLLSSTMSGREFGMLATYTANYGLLYFPGSAYMGHAWSLSVEEHFYLIWPPIVAFLVPQNSRRVLLGVFFPIALGTVLYLLLRGTWDGIGAFRTPGLILQGSAVRFASLALGALLAYHENWIRKGKWPLLLILAGALALGLALSEYTLRQPGVARWLNQYEVTGHPPFSYRFWISTRVIFAPCLSVILVLLAIAGTERKVWWSSLCSAPWRLPVLAWIGRISYGLYLYHLPIFLWTRNRPGLDPAAPTAETCLRGLAFAFAAATLSYFVIEKPLMKYARRFRS